jgi:thioredoxin reductase (NADPH)
MLNPVDCLVVGGGPAGLTAAIYLARFRLSVIVVDEGFSRAALIPLTRNHAGFPGGIAGVDLLGRMREQAKEYGAALMKGRVVGLTRHDNGFQCSTTLGALDARTVLLATGVTNRRPAMPANIHDAALRTGHIRYCPVCDGFEVTDQRVAVIGPAERSMKEVDFLRSYTRFLTLAPYGASLSLESGQRQALVEAGVVILREPPEDFQITDGAISFLSSGRRHVFDAIYPAMGSDIHSGLARALSANLTDEGCIKVDVRQRTSVQGLYAAGDVVVGLDQISHAMGEAGVAATTMRNDLADASPLRR